MSQCEHEWDTNDFCKRCGINYTIGYTTAYRLVEKDGKLLLQAFYREENWITGWRDIPTIKLEQDQ